MSTEDLIPMELYCQHEELDITFVRALTDRGLIELVIREERSYLAPERNSGDQKPAAALELLAGLLGGEPATSPGESRRGPIAGW